MAAQIVQELISVCKEKFGKHDCIVRSPGRINLIGEHTDYNMGFVLPASIDKAIYIAIQKRDDDIVRLVSVDMKDEYQTGLASLSPSGRQWPDYILGVIDQLKRAGHDIHGFNAVITGDVPLGAGLSSSAAVECATAFALNELFNLGLERKAMVQLSQKAENEFVGVQCGIMDQFASMFGQKGKLIRLDCRSLEFAYMPFPSAEVDILLLDTGVKHSLASSEYNLRRQECEAGVAIIKNKYPFANSLRDVSIEMMEECLAGKNDIVYKRCKYVVQEIQRLQDACNDLIENNLVAFGKKMFSTHEGLSNLYEVSCPEADTLVNMVKENPDVFGARMMGGGFGGCTINIVRKGKAAAIVNNLSPQYYALFKKELKSYHVSIDEGSSIVNV